VSSQIPTCELSKPANGAYNGQNPSFLLTSQVADMHGPKTLTDRPGKPHRY